MRRCPGSVAVVVAGLALTAMADPPSAPDPPHADAGSLADAADASPIVSVPASFNPLPGMWGLERLDDEMPLEDLDASFALYIDKRARIPITTGRGTIRFAEGALIGAEDETSSCTCTLEYETTSTTELHVAAGVYRLAKPPVLTRPETGVVRVELELDVAGQGDRTKLRRLVWTGRDDDRVASFASAIPAFAKLTRKRHVTFVDPPRDERLVLDREVRPPGDPNTPRRTIVVFAPRFDEHSPLARGSQALELPPSKPGVLTLLRQLGSGKKLTIDNSGYFEPRDEYLMQLDRDTGLHFRDPFYWP